jgi:hypothetical protein
MKTIEEVKLVFLAVHRCRIRGDDLTLYVDEDTDDAQVLINCSDMFFWGCADSEPIEADDVALLQSCFNDLKALDPQQAWYVHTGDLYCARKRQMRPQGAQYKHFNPIVWPLFNACGPHRPSEFGNPYETPAS